MCYSALFDNHIKVSYVAPLCFKSFFNTSQKKDWNTLISNVLFNRVNRLPKAPAPQIIPQKE